MDYLERGKVPKRIRLFPERGIGSSESGDYLSYMKISKVAEARDIFWYF
jgi:hypothetical protein